MAKPKCFWYLVVPALAFFVSRLGISTADPSFSFNFKGFAKDPNFEKEIVLFGAAKVVRDGDSIQMSNSAASGGGRIVYKKPINLVKGNNRNVASFSTYFAFKMSHQDGYGLAFVMAPSGSALNLFGTSSSPDSERNRTGEVVSVEFDASKKSESGVSIENRLQINVGGFASDYSTRSSSLGSVPKNETLYSWIDYEASYKRLEVRLSRSDGTKPSNPLLSYAIDLQNLWKDKEVFMGLTTNGESYWKSFHLYSWTFGLRFFPHWLHSKPVSPEDISNKHQPWTMKGKKSLLKSAAFVGSISALAALWGFALMHLWVIVSRRRLMLQVISEEYGPDPNAYKYEKVVISEQDEI